ncbi:MAG: tyrosine-type recombinase/integrase [Phycisphaeraceae bacterium]
MAQVAMRLTNTTDPMRFNFKKRELEALTPPNGKTQRKVYDAIQPGLMLLVTQGGAKTFYFAKRMDGRYRRVKIGPFPDVSIEQARKKAAGHLSGVYDGKNPAEERRQAHAAMTFAEMFDLYIEKHAKIHKRTWADDQANYDRHLKRWGSRRLDGIKRADVQQLHGRIGKDRPVMANRVLALLSKVFNFAVTIGCEVPNPSTGVQRFKEQTRERFMDADELPRFLKAVEAVKNVTLKDYFKVLLFTGGRRRNVAAMRWDELDMRRKIWTIPAEKFKTGQALEVPLVPQVVEIIEARKELNAKRKAGPSGYVFPSKKAKPKNPYLDDPRRAFDRICSEAEIVGLTLHDLRRTVASWATSEGIPYPVVGRMIGHTVQGVTAIYARTDMPAVRDGFERTVNAMLAAKGGE